MSTESIALVIGAYCVAAGIGMLIEPHRFASIFDELRERPGLAYITGVFVFFLGGFLLIAHNAWSGWLEIVVTLIAIGALVEGAAFLAVPEPFMRLSTRMVQAGPMRLWAGAAIVLGLALVAGAIVGLR